MQKQHIYTIGETVYDVIFKHQQPVAARAGGAMLNTAISLGRLGLPVDLITEFGKDDIGSIILEFLKQNKVGTEHVYHYEQGKTALALAFLDEHDEAQYTFYKQYPKNRLVISEPSFQKDDIILFGSFASLLVSLRPALMQLLKKAKDAGAIIIYDPNFRKPHLSDLPNVKPFIIENIEIADIVRGSFDDFKLIFDVWNSKEAFRHIQNAGCKSLIVTNAGEPVHYISESIKLHVETPRVNPVSTIGAGDSFNAGLIYGLVKLHIRKNDLPALKSPEWETLINIGVAFGSSVCESLENYIPSAFAKRLCS